MIKRLRHFTFLKLVSFISSELNSNSNAPAEDPGIFTKTQVNQ